MLDIFFGKRDRRCDGVSRRDFLRVGAIGGLALPTHLPAADAPAAKKGRTRAKSVLLLHLGGGLSHDVRGRTLSVDVRVRNALNTRYNDFLSRYKLFAYEPGRNVVLRLSTGL